jgi:hypothetical protein
VSDATFSLSFSVGTRTDISTREAPREFSSDISIVFNMTDVPLFERKSAEGSGPLNSLSSEAS